MLRIALIVCGLVVLVLGGGALYIYHAIGQDPFMPLYQENCGVCHGDRFQGAAQGVALVGRDLKHGDSIEALSLSIARGFPQSGMPAWGETLSDAQIQSLAILISEKRVGRVFTDFKVDADLVVPTGVQSSERHDFRVEVVASGLDPLPYSIALLPDGRILVTEKMKGLRIVDAEGSIGELIVGTPEVHEGGIKILDLEYGLGWMMDVAIHPDFEENGWIYLHYGDRCSDCNETSRGSFFPVSMNAVVRGRIVDGAWTDEETIWKVDRETYGRMPDMAAGGRLAFDDEDHLFISVGMKGNSNYDGIQDLSMPYGKIHRVHDDGRVPDDNPFADVPDAMKSTWTYGHRSPQGLEFDPRTGLLWGTEMGPRGGDEVNLLRPGRNYGWPLTSKGVDYDGTPVEYGKDLGIEFDLEDIEQPVVDLTPSPAISSFTIYDGDAFPEWRGNLFIGSLKATELYRMEVEGETITHTETLLRDFTRIRDVETAPDGSIYLLLEHGTGGQIVRLVPD